MMKMAFALFGLCMVDLLLTLRQGGSRYFMWFCFSQSLAMTINDDGVRSIGVVHGGTAVDPPLRRQQVLHVVLLKSESRHDYIMKMACALYGLCMEELLLTLR